MDVIKAIAKRRSIRSFKDKRVDKDDLLFLCELGMKAPNAGNLQDFRFIITTDKRIIRQLPSICMDQEWIAQAKGLIVICSQPSLQIKWYGDKGKWFATQGTSAAAQNILLGAESLGLGATWVSGFDEDKINRLFKIDKDAKVEMIIPIGYASGKPDIKTENGIDVMVYFDTYGNDKADILALNKDYSVKLERFIEDRGEDAENISKKIKKIGSQLIENFKENIKKGKEKTKK